MRNWPLGRGLQAALPLNSLPSEGTLLICASGLSPWWLSHLLPSLPARSCAAQSLGSCCPRAALCVTVGLDLQHYHPPIHACRADCSARDCQAWDRVVVSRGQGPGPYATWTKRGTRGWHQTVQEQELPQACWLWCPVRAELEGTPWQAQTCSSAQRGRGRSL